MVSSGSSKRILIADDEADIRLLVNRMLGKDYVILEAADGDEAVNAARMQKPDLILMDIMMPGSDGYSACYAIKADPATKSIPVIMVTGIGHKLNEKFSAEMGADGYVTKPFSLEKLMGVIDKFLPGTG